MGNLLSYWWGEDPHQKNPMTGLSRHEVSLVQKTWNLVNADPINKGVIIFRKLFQEFPDTKNLFQMMKNVDENDLLRNTQFKAHVLGFMSAFNLMIMNLNQPEIAAALMGKLGESHARQHVEEQQFKDFKTVLRKIIQEDFKLDEPTTAAWNKTIDFMNKLIFRTLNKKAIEQK